jgi:hypothetical protein
VGESRVQPGEAGIITDYLGSKPGINDAKSALDAFRTDLPKMSPKMAESLDPNAVTAWFWIVYPFTLEPCQRQNRTIHEALRVGR